MAHNELNHLPKSMNVKTYAAHSVPWTVLLNTSCDYFAPFYRLLKDNNLAAYHDNNFRTVLKPWLID